jgi:tRNA/tmRNA/rRNA uracil-C5-methylase (TrmA/RlmC/RlmD family)
MPSRKILTLTIESLSNSGDGVARDQKRVVFVPFALPGERVEVEIIFEKKSFSKARLRQVLIPSPHRVSPRCPVFTRCGGCDWQNLAYEQQLHWKQRNLRETLQRIGGLHVDGKVAEIHPSPDIFFYRNRIQLNTDKDGYYYFAKESQVPVLVSECPIARPAINEWLHRTPQPPRVGTKIELAEMDDGKVSVFPVNKVGQSELGFRQVNDLQNQYLQQQLIDFVQEVKAQRLIDLYCGQGNWSLALAKNLPHLGCLGIDTNATSIRQAKSKAPSNCHFEAGDALDLLKNDQGRADVIVVDPPRAGCSPQVLEQLTQRPPLWLVYISCHPATLARDLKVLVQGGWVLQRLQPIDMFPQTAHLECLTILQSANCAKTANR